MAHWTRILGLLAAFFVAAPATAFELQGEPRIAFIYASTVNDGGWTESFDYSRTRIEKELGMTIAYTENVPEDNVAVTQAIDLYVNRGHNIIVGTAYGYGDAFLEAAGRYPNVAFLNGAGETNAVNLESFYVRTYQGWYLAGIIAGSVTKTKKLGMLGGFPLALDNWDINGFIRGVRSVSPDAEVIVIYTNSWWDPAKEGQAAEAILEQGADVIAPDLSAASALIAAEKKEAWTVGFQIDMSKNAPNGHLTSVVFNWDSYLLPTIKKIMTGEWETEPWGAFAGIDIGVVGLSPINNKVPEEILTKVDAAKQAMIAGELSPFDGPLYYQDGTLILGEGDRLTDEQLWAMDYFVQGTIGTMPVQ